jgi:pimeloyl-ACP methyl ester carboxylesterase
MPVKRFEADDGVEIACWEWGNQASSPPVVLHHGFAADANSNWVATGVVEALGGRYGEQRMARDLDALLDRIGAEEVDLVGYSMGAIVALLLASEDPRVRRLVVGGIGSGVIECGGVDRRTVSSEAIIEALEVEDPGAIRAPGALRYRQIADATGGDRRALAAQARSVFRAEAVVGATLRILHGDHIGALGDPRFKQSIVDFLAT